MRCKAKYNPERDICKLNPVGWINLKDAYVNGVIPGDIDFDENDSNGIDEPSQVGESPRDVFQARRLAESARKFVEARQNNVDKPSPGTDEPGDN